MKRVLTILSVFFALGLMSCSQKINAAQGATYLLDAIQNFDSIDSDGNGKLSTSEVAGELLSNFTNIDSNNDSGLSLDELISAKDTLGL